MISLTEWDVRQLHIKGIERLLRSMENRLELQMQTTEKQITNRKVNGSLWDLKELDAIPRWKVVDVYSQGVAY